MSLGTAVITGAGGGLGTAFARALAELGHDLFLTDRDEAALGRIAAELSESQRRVTAQVADLTLPDDVAGLRSAIEALNPEMLVNNAGFGTFSLFHESDLARELAMVEVHIATMMNLCRAVLPGMVARGRGSVINVASAGAYWRFPRDATYIGTKAFVVAFTECLGIELAGTGVRVQALCPGWMETGYTGTESYARVGYRSPIPRWLFTSPTKVVESSLRSLGRGRVSHIPTRRVRIAALVLGSRIGLGALAWMRRIRGARQRAR